MFSAKKLRQETTKACIVNLTDLHKIQLLFRNNNTNYD